jgi:hypothetical protein
MFSSKAIRLHTVNRLNNSKPHKHLFDNVVLLSITAQQYIFGAVCQLYTFPSKLIIGSKFLFHRVYETAKSKKGAITNQPVMRPPLLTKTAVLDPCSPKLAYGKINGAAEPEFIFN